MHRDLHGALGQVEAGGDGPIRRQLTGVGQVRQERIRLGGLTGQFAFHAQALERTVESDGRPFAIEDSLGCVFVAALECVDALRILEIEGQVYQSSSAPH